MAKSKRRTKETITTKKSKEGAKGKKKAAEFVSCLLELHRIQGSLLNQLSKEV